MREHLLRVGLRPVARDFSCAVDPTAPVQELEPEVRCVPSGDIGLRLSPTCTLVKGGAVTVEVKVDLLFDGCANESGLDPLSVEVLPGEDGWDLTEGGLARRIRRLLHLRPAPGPDGWLLLNVYGTTPVEG